MTQTNSIIRKAELEAAMARLKGLLRAYDDTRRLLDDEIRRVLLAQPEGEQDLSETVRESLNPLEIKAYISGVASELGYKVMDESSGLTVVSPGEEE